VLLRHIDYRIVLFVSGASVVTFPTGLPIMVIDVGSGTINTNQFVLAGQYPSLLFKNKIVAKLAQGTGESNRLPKTENVHKAIEGLKNILPIIQCFQDVRIVGTSALREIQNTPEGHKIIKDLEAALGGRKIHILSGEEEAEYMGRAIVSEFPQHFLAERKKNSHKAFIGIGGGSIQTGVFVDGEVAEMSSIPYGVQTLIEESKGSLTKAKTLLGKHLPKLSADKIDTLYATGGNWRTLAKLVTETTSAYTKDPQSPNAVKLSFKQAKAVLTKIIRGDFQLPPNSDRTEEEIIFGAQALLVAARKYKAKDIILCDSTMRHGISTDRDFHTRFVSPKLAA